MSLINQMLQDLEKRPTANGETPLPAGVQSTARAAPRRWQQLLTPRHLLLGVALLVALVYAGWPRPVMQPPPVAVLPGLAQDTPAPPVSVVTVPDGASPAARPAKPAQAKVVDQPKSSQAHASPSAEGEAPRLSRAEKRRLAREQRAAEKAAEKAARAALAPPLAVDHPGAAKVAKTPVGDEISQRAEQAYQGALAAYSAGRSQESRSLAGETLQLQPRHVAARQLLIRQNVEQGQMGRAIELVRDGTRLIPEQGAWWTLLAQLELGRGKLAEARSVIDGTPAGARNTAGFNALAGAIAQRQGDADAAADFYRQALRYDARSGRDWVGLALALEKQGHVAESLEALRRAQATQNLSDELLQLARSRLARHESTLPVASQ